MSKITITDITEGSTMNPSDVTDTVDSWKSSAVNGSNVRDEGLDERMFAPQTAAITNEFHEWQYNDSIQKYAPDYKDEWRVVWYTSGGNVPSVIGPIKYNTTESTVVVRFNAGLIMPTNVNSHKAVPKDSKMTMGYRLAYIISPNMPAIADWNSDTSTYRATPFRHTFRKVALSAYPRQAIGSSRYKNNICTTLVLNDSSTGRDGRKWPKPSPGDSLWIGVQFRIYEYEGDTRFFRNNQCYFTIRNANLNCAHYKR